MSIPDTGGVGEMVFGRLSSVVLSVFGIWDTYSTLQQLLYVVVEEIVWGVYTRAGEARLDLATFSFRSITTLSCNGER